jgi:hypothetical protein
MGNTQSIDDDDNNKKQIKFGGFSIKFEKNKKLTEQLGLFENIINNELEDIHQLILKDEKKEEKEEKDKINEEENFDEMDDEDKKNDDDINTNQKFYTDYNISNEIQNLNFGTDEFNKAFQRKINVIRDTKSEIIKYIKMNK